MEESNGYRFPIPGGLVEVTLLDVVGSPLETPLRKQASLVHMLEDVIQSHGAAGAVRQAQAIQVSPQIGSPGPRSIRVETLRLYVLDTKTQSWFRLPNNNLDQLVNEVLGGVQHMGVFSVMGSAYLDVSDTIAYPVPWRPFGPNAGTGAGQTGTEAGGITFSNLPQEGRLVILDLQGRLVREILLTGNVSETWDVKNEDAQKVVSGTYYWVVEAGGNRKTGKLVIIR